MSSIDPILSVVSTWATERGDIVAVALIGSHARGSPSVDSDIDLVVLTPNPNSFRKSAWLAQIRWGSLGRTVATYRDAVYGAVWSRHVTMRRSSSVLGPLPGRRHRHVIRVPKPLFEQVVVFCMTLRVCCAHWFAMRPNLAVNTDAPWAALRAGRGAPLTFVR
jgi:predicted nucleotidyltransferase